MFKSSLAALLFTTALMAAPAQAQSRKELAAQNIQLAERISVLESRLLTGDPAAERLMARMDSLETAQRSLTGELERLRYERDTLKGEVVALSGDIRAMQELSDRMRIHLEAVDLVAKEQQSRLAPRTYGPTIEGQPSAVPEAPVFKEQELVIDTSPNQPSTENSSLGGNDVAQLGEVGKTKLSEGDFVGAQTALSQYIQFNPDATDIGEMNFWLGESYYVRGGYADAADAFIASMRTDPKGVKAPDAMVRLAATLRQLGNTTEACQTLAAFPKQFPKASATVKEKARIEAVRTGC